MFFPLGKVADVCFKNMLKVGTALDIWKFQFVKKIVCFPSSCNDVPSPYNITLVCNVSLLVQSPECLCFLLSSLLLFILFSMLKTVNTSLNDLTGWTYCSWRQITVLISGRWLFLINVLPMANHLTPP